MASPPVTPFLYAGGTNFSVALRGMTIFALLEREVTFWGKYLHWGNIFLRQMLFYFIFLILWSSAKDYLSYKNFFYHKVTLDVQLMIFFFFFFFEEKIFCSRDI